MGRQGTANNLTEVSVVVRRGQLSPAQKAAWVRLWQHLLSPAKTLGSDAESSAADDGEGTHYRKELQERQ